MSKIKKLIALTLALAMVLSVSAFAGSYSKDTYADADKINSDCESAIELLYALDIMVGDGKNFNPESAVTRAEMAKMIYVILNYGDDDKAVTYTGAKFFTDVEAGYWAEGYINYCASTKLIAGRGDGTFGPTDAVTTAEAAKMLLTAIGYQADARGYTGANWDKNVLADAAILGLLDGYKSNVNLAAPRQWVAVIVANALDCLTYSTMAPSFNGLLVSGSDWDEDYEYPTMGEKYYGYKSYTGYVVYANGYAIDAYTLADGVDIDDYDFVLDIGKATEVALEGDVTIEDLGQQFKVIAIDGEVISMRNTGKSVVAEDEVKDVTYELTYSTSANKYNNKYEFTVDELTGKLGLTNDNDKAIANVLDVVDGTNAYVEMTADTLKSEIAGGEYRNDIVRAIDKDGDGDIEYVIYTPVEYGVVTKVATSQKYGDYIKANNIAGTAMKFNEGSNLYVEDCIITEDELEVGNYFKFTWNIDEEKYNVEVLPVQEFVEFESRKIRANEFTFGGETYNIAANCFTNIEDLTVGGKLEKDYDIVVDGDLLVQVVPSDDNYTMDEVNAKLAVLIKSGLRNLEEDNVPAVKLLTIDGEQSWYAYDLAGATDAAEDDANILVWNDVADTNMNGKDVDWDQLVIVHTNDDGEVYLETIPADADLNLKTELVDNVTDKKAQLVVKDGTAKFDGTKLAADNQFFAKIDDEYCIVTVEDLAEGTYSGVDAQSLVNVGTYYDTIVGGYLIIDDADPTTSKGFLFILDVYEKEYEDDDDIIYVLFNDEEGTEAEIEVTNDIATLVENDLYYYTCTDGVYTLSYKWNGAKDAVADEDGILWYGKNDDCDLSDYDVYALKNVIWERDEEDGEWEIYETVVKFLTAEELEEFILECVNADETNNYGYKTDSDTTSHADDDLLIVRVDTEMFANQYEDEGDNQVQE